MKTKIALLLIDIQNDYFKGGLNPLVGSSEAGLKAQVILQHFRLQGLPIIHIQHISTKQGATFFLPNTKGAKIHENVAPLKEENVIIKHTPNSFHRTILDNLLRSQDITDLVICGMMTQMCVDATVRAAKDLRLQLHNNSRCLCNKRLRVSRSNNKSKRRTRIFSVFAQPLLFNYHYNKRIYKSPNKQEER